MPAKPKAEIIMIAFSVVLEFKIIIDKIKIAINSIHSLGSRSINEFGL